jgi:hypothetical protein
MPCAPSDLWPDERIAKLISLWNETDLLAIQIADELGCFKQYRDGGRAAVLGKAHRLNLKSKWKGFTRYSPEAKRLGLLPQKRVRVEKKKPSGVISIKRSAVPKFKAPVVESNTTRTSPSYRNQLGRAPEMTVGERRNFLAQAVRNTVAMQSGLS